MIDSIIVFDGTSHFVESLDYELGEGEEQVFKGSFARCSQKCASLNDACFDKPRTTWSFGFAK